MRWCQKRSDMSRVHPRLLRSVALSVGLISAWTASVFLVPNHAARLCSIVLFASVWILAWTGVIWPRNSWRVRGFWFGTLVASIGWIAFVFHRQAAIYDWYEVLVILEPEREASRLVEVAMLWRGASLLLPVSALLSMVAVVTVWACGWSITWLRRAADRELQTHRDSAEVASTQPVED